MNFIKRWILKQILINAVTPIYIDKKDTILIFEVKDAKCLNELHSIATGIRNCLLNHHINIPIIVTHKDFFSNITQIEKDVD